MSIPIKAPIAGIHEHPTRRARPLVDLGWTWAEIAAIAVDPVACHRLDEARRQRKIERVRVRMQRQKPLMDALG